jgi:hypothetical protein
VLWRVRRASKRRSREGQDKAKRQCRNKRFHLSSPCFDAGLHLCQGNARRTNWGCDKPTTRARPVADLAPVGRVGVRYMPNGAVPRFTPARGIIQSSLFISSFTISSFIEML